MNVGHVHPAAESLRDRLGTLPAIGWLKDTEGRYVYANSCYLERLGTSEDRLLGRTDAELPPGEAIDGPRLHDGAAIADQLLQVEYRVGAFESRHELTVMRFPLRDQTGTAVGVCGIAAPVGDRELVSLCDELLELSGHQPASAPVRLSVAPPAAEPLDALAVNVLDDELERERRRADRLEQELAAVRAELDALRHPAFAVAVPAPVMG
jgi:PAS domain-containing protein